VKIQIYQQQNKSTKQDIYRNKINSNSFENLKLKKKKKLIDLKKEKYSAFEIRHKMHDKCLEKYKMSKTNGGTIRYLRGLGQFHPCTNFFPRP